MIIRPITEQDADAYLNILERTSEEDRYCRFFHVINHFDLDSIGEFIHMTPDTLGFIAENQNQAFGVIHAFGILDDTPEIAIVVANNVRRQHIGHALLDRMLQELWRRDVASVTAYSLSGNNALSKLVQSFGMVPIGPPNQMMTWRITVPAAV